MNMAMKQTVSIAQQGDFSLDSLKIQALDELFEVLSVFDATIMMMQWHGGNRFLGAIRSVMLLMADEISSIDADWEHPIYLTSEHVKYLDDVIYEVRKLIQIDDGQFAVTNDSIGQAFSIAGLVLHRLRTRVMKMLEAEGVESKQLIGMIDQLSYLCFMLELCEDSPE